MMTIFLTFFSFHESRKDTNIMGTQYKEIKKFYLFAHFSF